MSHGVLQGSQAHICECAASESCHPALGCEHRSLMPSIVSSDRYKQLRTGTPRPQRLAQLVAAPS